MKIALQAVPFDQRRYKNLSIVSHKPKLFFSPPVYSSKKSIKVLLPVRHHRDSLYAVSHRRRWSDLRHSRLHHLGEGEAPLDPDHRQSQVRIRGPFTASFYTYFCLSLLPHCMIK